MKDWDQLSIIFWNLECASYKICKIVLYILIPCPVSAQVNAQVLASTFTQESHQLIKLGEAVGAVLKSCSVSKRPFSRLQITTQGNSTLPTSLFDYWLVGAVGGNTVIVWYASLCWYDREPVTNLQRRDSCKYKENVNALFCLKCSTNILLWNVPVVAINLAWCLSTNQGIAWSPPLVTWPLLYWLDCLTRILAVPQISSMYWA